MSEPRQAQGDASAPGDVSPPPFKAGDRLVYLGPRSNRTWGQSEAPMLAIGKVYEVEASVWATATDGELVPAVRLQGVRSVILETGRASRSYAADNFALADAADDVGQDRIERGDK